MNFLRWNHILCALAINLLPAKAAQIAYSVADFSSVQGQRNWYYGYFEKGLPSEPGYTPDDFELLDRYVPNVDPNLSRWTLTPPPGESYGGYPWKLPESGSQWSVVRYIDYLRAREPAGRADIRREIETYNRDDVLATRALEVWLRRFAADNPLAATE